MMTLAEQIIERAKALPDAVQAEVPDFVEFREAKKNAGSHVTWSRFSLSQAVRGTESEPALYSLDDVKNSL